MSTDSPSPQISVDDFARRFSRRGGNLMWLMGAGASASAGVPTASEMIWAFKKELFITQQRAARQSVADLSNPAIRDRLQAHIDSSDGLPAPGDVDEYAALFEAVYPSEQDRRAYLDAKLVAARPSYGHIGLATLMRAGLTRLVWTTNFDTLLADACAKVYGTTGKLTTVALDAPEQAGQLIGDNRWPIEVKLHGDFRSRRLKNTSDELRHQDVCLRQQLSESCQRFGLIVVGYSGRDHSIMQTLREAIQRPSAFPSGLFWLFRGEDSVLPPVVDFVQDATAAGIEAGFIPIENFDETIRDLIRPISDLDTDILDSFAAERPRWTSAPAPTGHRSWPVVRLNALPVLQLPTICRRVVCQIGGAAEVRDLVEKADVDILVARTRAGVLAYGSDSSVRGTFESYEITDFTLHTIETRRLRYDSGERGLLRNALTRAIQRRHDFTVVRRRSADLLAPRDPTDPKWTRLRQLVGNLGGTLEGPTDLRWMEGISVRLDWAHDRLWLLVDPRIVFPDVTDENKALAADFARERTVKRYNRQLNDLLSFWVGLLAGTDEPFTALGISDGVDAAFLLGAETAFSWKSQT